jgi:two-component system cell cycle response regulator CtrA
MLGREQLLAALYSLLSSGDEAEIKIIDIYVCKLRRKLAGMDITIETVWARGYRLVVGREAQRSRAGDASADRANLGELLS